MAQQRFPDELLEEDGSGAEASGGREGALNFLDELMAEDGLDEQSAEAGEPERPPVAELAAPAKIHLRFRSNNLLVTVAGPSMAKPKPLSGLKGINSRGSFLERRTWNLGMQVTRMRSTHAKKEQDLLALLMFFQKRRVCNLHTLCGYTSPSGAT